jgi:hypothetical protein
MKTYTRQFLIDAFLFRFERAGLSVLETKPMAEKFYDEVGKDKFRVYCSLDAEKIREFQQYCNEFSLEYK